MAHCPHDCMCDACVHYDSLGRAFTVYGPEHEHDEPVYVPPTNYEIFTTPILGDVTLQDLTIAVLLMFTAAFAGMTFPL